MISDEYPIHRDIDIALDDSFFEVSIDPSLLDKFFDNDPPNHDSFSEPNLISDTEASPSSPIKPEPSPSLQESQAGNNSEPECKGNSKPGNEHSTDTDIQPQTITTSESHLESQLSEENADPIQQPHIQPHLSDPGITRVGDTNLQNAQQAMEAWLAEHSSNPYLPPTVANDFARTFGMTVTQVRTLFTNTVESLKEKAATTA